MEKTLTFQEFFGDYQRQMFLIDHAGLPLKTVLEQLDLLGGEVVPVLRKEFEARRPAGVPSDPPKHAGGSRRATRRTPVPPSSEGRTGAAVEAWEALFRVQSTLLRRFAEQDVWGGLSVREYDVLYTLSRSPQGRCRLGELSEDVYLPQPSLSRLVDRLARRGLRPARPTPPTGAASSSRSPGPAPRAARGGRTARGEHRPGAVRPRPRRTRANSHACVRTVLPA